jgi:hypothetical protein
VLVAKRLISALAVSMPPPAGEESDTFETTIKLSGSGPLPALGGRSPQCLSSADIWSRSQFRLSAGSRSVRRNFAWMTVCPVQVSPVVILKLPV